jgi:hypothetical protein
MDETKTDVCPIQDTPAVSLFNLLFFSAASNHHLLTN